MYEIVFIGKNFENFKENYPTARHALTFQLAKQHCSTKFVWIVWDDVVLESNFNFDYVPDNWSKDVIHVFKNGLNYDGICLVPTHIDYTQEEIDNRLFTNKKEVDILASNPRAFDLFYVDTWDEYNYALENSSTELFWMVSHNLSYDNKFVNNFYFSHHNTYDRHENHAFVHYVDNQDLYNGVFLCSKHKLLDNYQVEHRILINGKLWNEVVSRSCKYPGYTVKSYQDYISILNHIKTEMFWITPTDILVSNEFDFDLYFSHDNEFDRKINHVFKNGKFYDGIMLCSKHSVISNKEFNYRFIYNKKDHNVTASTPQPYDRIIVNNYNDFVSKRLNTTSEFLWVVPNDVNVVFNFDYQIPYWEKDNVYIFKNGSYNDGIFLIHKDKHISKKEFEFCWYTKKKEVSILASTPQPYDIVFISYNESNADKNYINLLKRFPNTKRVHGVKGIHQAHIEAAKLCNTDMFWVVDGDASIVTSFNFDYQVPKWQRDQVFVWQSQNPINNLVYGYGGVKLFPKKETINMDVESTDMTTSISSKFNLVEQVSNITEFNTSPFETWKSAFRECCKLASKTINRQESDETDARLSVWCSATGRDRPFGDFAIQGARAGRKYGVANQGNIDALRKINNFEWLKEQFNE